MEHIHSYNDIERAIRKTLRRRIILDVQHSILYEFDPGKAFSRTIKEQR